MFTNNPFSEAFGIDIGDLSLKLVKLSARKKISGDILYKVEETNIVPLPAGYIVNGEIQQPEMVRKKILQLLGRIGENQPKKILAPWVVADLPEPKTFLTSIEIEIPAEQVTQEDVEYQAQKHLPFDLSDAYLDWEIIPSQEDSKFTRILIGASQKAIADSYTYLLESVGLQPIALEIESLAIARALVKKTDQAKAVLDLGATRSAIVIYDQGGVRFSTAINFSGEIITAALQKNLNLDYQTAEELKIKNGLNYTKEYPNYLKVADELIDDLVKEIKKIILYYQEHYPNTDRIEQIKLCGGMSEMQNLPGALGRRLKIKCDLISPWENMNTDKLSDEEKKHGLTMVSATGLAMRAIINPYNE